MKKALKNAGFSLLEIMVVVAIIAIMSSAVVIGFGSFSASVQVQETAGILTDIVKKLELETLHGTYQSNNIEFEEHYLAVDSTVDGATLTLDYIGYDTGDCPDAVHLIPKDSAQMAKRDQEGNNLELMPVNVNDNVCIDDFVSADIREWQFALFDATQKSNDIRLFHFNTRRLENATPIRIVSGANYRLEIEGPYAKKKFWDDDLGAYIDSTVQLTLETEELEQRQITLQE